MREGRGRSPNQGSGGYHAQCGEKRHCSVGGGAAPRRHDDVFRSGLLAWWRRLAWRRLAWRRLAWRRLGLARRRLARRRRWGWGPGVGLGVIGGLATGAIIGSALASPYYGYGYGYGYGGCYRYQPVYNAAGAYIGHRLVDVCY